MDFHLRARKIYSNIVNKIVVLRHYADAELQMICPILSHAECAYNLVCFPSQRRAKSGQQLVISFVGDVIVIECAEGTIVFKAIEIA